MVRQFRLTLKRSKFFGPDIFVGAFFIVGLLPPATIF
jgi:hypothetical protein